jgi:serine/threonine-protein kinase
MGGEQQRGPIAETDYIDGDEDYEEDETKKPKKKKSSNKKKKKIIIIACAAVAAILIALGICFATGILGGKEIEAPDLTGMTLEQAEEVAAEYDLKVKEGDEVISEDVDKGLIVSQDPAPKETIKTGSTITVNISKGLGDGSVPDLTGKSQSELSDYLEAAGFKLGSVTTEASDKEKGIVLSQDPSAGSEVEKGTAINVVVSDGSKAKASMPYLVGKSVSEASSALSNAGLSMGSISYEYSNTYAEGEVIWQQYDANAQLDKGTSVRVRVSKGSKPESTQATDSAQQ